MTISTEVRKAGPFIGNGSASVFPFAFKVFKAADLIVVRRQDNIGTETTLVLDSDYHVTLNSNQDTTPGGVVTLVAGALASGFTLVVSSELPYLQPTDLTNQGGFYPKVITNALDRLTIFCQQLLEITGRTLKLPITAPTNISAEIPLPNPSELIAWDETGTRLTTVSPQSLVTSIAYGSATADLFAGDGVTTTFPLSTNPASVNNLDVSIGGYSQRPVQDGVGDYSWNGGASITFVAPPPAPAIPGDKNVLVRYMQAIPVSDSEALHAQTREALRRGYAEAGFNLVDGSFETGGTLTAATDVLLQESTGFAYGWTGALPKTVAPGFDPVGVAGFELHTNVVLRGDLSEIDGAGVIGVCPDISTLRNTEPEIHGQRIFLRGYHADAPGYGGADFWYDSTDTTSSDDGGMTIVTSGGKRWKRRTDKISVFDFGAKPGAAYDSKPAFVAASAAAQSRGIGEVRVEFNCAVSQFTHPKGIYFIGQGRQTYGEFANQTSTDITLLATAGQWGWLIPQYNTLGGLRNITLVGDWTNHGIKSNLQTSREFELSNVSIRNVFNGMNTIDAFFSGFGNVTITCRGIGFNNSGGGTTLELSRFIVQGDKANSIRCTDCFKFSQDDYPSNPLSSSMLRVAAGQYCERVFNISASTRLIIDCTNVEDYSECAFLIHDTYKTKLSIRNPGILGASGIPIFKFAGTIAAQTEVDLGLISASDNVDVTPTAIFMQDGAGLAANGKVYINYGLYDKVISQIGTLCRTMLVVRKEYRHAAGDAIWLNGASSYQVTFAELDQLWQATMAYFKTTARLEKGGGSIYGNGLTFTVNSSATSGGAPNFTIVSVRSAAPAAMSKVDITGTHNIVADFANGYLTITPVSTAQSIVIRAS